MDRDLKQKIVVVKREGGLVDIQNRPAHENLKFRPPRLDFLLC